MSKKAARLYGRMQHGIAQRNAKLEELQRRRKDIDASKEKNPDGKTMLKLKVDRLRKERKSIEKGYANTGGSMKKKRKVRKD